MGSSNAALPDAIAQVFITDELLARVAPEPNHVREKLALQELAASMADHPDDVLPRLVKLSLELCDADSAGISVLEGDVFRWTALVGALSVFNGATTPRNHSPCGVCLDQSLPILMKNPENAYSWISDVNIVVPEVLLVPLLRHGDIPFGTLWVVAKDGQKFNSMHARALSEMAVFTGIALQRIHTDQQMKELLHAQELLTKEMGHRVQNLFSVMSAMIRMSARKADTKDELAKTLSGRLDALAAAHALVRQSFSAERALSGVSLADVIGSVIKPYAVPDLGGPSVELGERATTNLALIYHELATNAAKYGALKNEGRVEARWDINGDNVDIVWREIGDAAHAPTAVGFGSTIVGSTIASHNGQIDYDWSSTGLIVRIKLPRDSLKH